MYFIILIFLKLFILYLYLDLDLSKKSKYNKIIIRLPNHLGDTLMTYPTLLALKKSNIDFICIGKKWTKELFSGTDIEIIANDNIKNYDLYNICKKLNCKYGILFTSHLSTTIPMRLSGLITYGNNYFCNYYIKPKRNNHTVVDYFNITKNFINSNIKLYDLNEKIPLNLKFIEKGITILSKINKDYIVICPYAKNLHKRQNKEWSHWKELCNIYKKYEIIILVSSDDLERCKLNFKKNKIFSEDLQTTAYIMKNAKYVLTNDSGAMHLGSFFGANVIGLFGITNIKKTRPWYGQYIIGNNGNFPHLKNVIDFLN